MNKVIINQKEFSELFGWSESTGRNKIKPFKTVLPTLKINSSISYDENAIYIMSYIISLKNNGFSDEMILKKIIDDGIPKDFKSEINLNGIKVDTFGLPEAQQITVKLLEILSDEELYTSTMIYDQLATIFKLTDKQKNLKHENSKDYIFNHKVRSVRYSLKNKGFIEEISKSTFKITSEGKALIVSDNRAETEEIEIVENPIEIALEKIKESEINLSKDVLEKIKKINWRKLEKVVVELLVAMGYGEGETTRATKDNGIDGIIKEDKLGLGTIYIQAKRWEKNISNSDVMAFAGALDFHGATKGVFITTSKFTKSAMDYIEQIKQKKVVPIDGEQLANLLIKYNVGIKAKQKIIIKELDFEYFNDED